MPRQEEMTIRRIATIANLLKEAQVMDIDELNAWCQVNQGITEKTVGRYIGSLRKLGVIEYNISTKIVRYIKKEVKQQ